VPRGCPLAHRRATVPSLCGRAWEKEKAEQRVEADGHELRRACALPRVPAAERHRSAVSLRALAASSSPWTPERAQVARAACASRSGTIIERRRPRFRSRGRRLPISSPPNAWRSAADRGQEAKGPTDDGAVSCNALIGLGSRRLTAATATATSVRLIGSFSREIICPGAGHPHWSGLLLPDGRHRRCGVRQAGRQLSDRDHLSRRESSAEGNHSAPTHLHCRRPPCWQQAPPLERSSSGFPHVPGSTGPIAPQAPGQGC